jgi:hypothetical protein
LREIQQIGVAVVNVLLHQIESFFVFRKETGKVFQYSNFGFSPEICWTVFAEFAIAVFPVLYQQKKFADFPSENQSEKQTVRPGFQGGSFPLYFFCIFHQCRAKLGKFEREKFEINFTSKSRQYFYF